MADKRSLYHLAPTQTPSPQIRKQLVQGRLIDDSALQASFNPERETVSKGYSPAVHRPKVTPTKPESSATTTEQENPRLKPPPQYTEPGQDQPLFSPTAIQPSSSLSLSENEDSNSSSHASEPLRRNDLSPSKQEVQVVTKTATSPVKVVCHSPRRSKAREDDEGAEVRGYADGAARVDVPGVAKIAVQVIDHEGRKPLVSHDGSISDDSLDHIKMIAGSPVDPNSSAVRIALDNNDKENAAMQHAYNPDQYRSFMGDEHRHQVGPLSAGMNQSNIRQPFNFSVASADSSTMETSTMAATSVTDDKKKKKKKAARVIPSRYMDIKKPPSAKKNTSNRPKVSFQNTSKDHSSLHDSTQLNVTAPHHNTSLKGSKIVTSTPAVRSIGVLPGGDMTAPTPILPPGRTAGSSKGVSPKMKSTSIKGIEDGRKNEEKSKKPMKMKAPLLPQDRVEHLAKQKGQDIGELSQLQLELQYGRLLQWIFLESKLKSTIQKQEKDAQMQLYSMWQENEKLRREVSELQLELDLKNKQAEIDEQITLQSSGLKSIGDNVTKQILCYEQLSSALNTTCQYMPVSGVILDNQEELLVALAESERLLGEIDSLTLHQGHKISTFSKEMDVLSKVTESEVQEQARCQELLAATSTLASQERSLQAHAIQQSLPLQHFSSASSDDHSL